MTARRGLAAWLLVVVLLSVAIFREARAQVFRARTDAVIVNVSVRDGRRPLTGLRKEDFELRDNGVVQPLADFTTEPLPVDVTLLFQWGGSRVQLDRVWTAIQKIAASLRPIDRCRLVTSGVGAVETPTALRPPPCAVNRAVQGQIDAESPAYRPFSSDDGSIYEALALMLAMTPAPDRRRLVLLITDGHEDINSFIDPPTVLDEARYSDVIVNAILAEDPRLDPRALRQAGHSSVKGVVELLASVTGGQTVVRDSQKDDIGQAAVDAMLEFQSSYVLAFTPHDRSHPGWHELSVRITKVGAGHYQLSARKGYMSPALEDSLFREGGLTCVSHCQPH
jgi:VWFA-related protein